MLGPRANKQLSLRSQTRQDEREGEGDEEENVGREEGTSPQNVPAGKRGPPSINLSKESGKRQCTRPPTSRHNQPVTHHTCRVDSWRRFQQILGQMPPLTMYKTHFEYFKPLKAFFHSV